MTAPAALPSLAGLAWSRHKKPGFSTRVASHVSGREVRVALMSYPLYEFEAVYNGLASSSTPAFAGLGSSSLQTLMGFFLQLLGQAGTFLYTDPDDNSVVGQSIAAGDGTTQSFVIGRTLGGWNEPVSWVTGITNVYLNGIAQASSTWVFTAPNSLAFGSAPGSGVEITADFIFAFQCRFLDDQMDFEEFMSALWKLDSMKFRSVKTNTTAAAVPAPTVLSISPSSGSTSGGTAVTITGTFFGSATAVTIDGVAATSVTVINSTTITATTGASPSGGTGNVVVVTPNGTGTGLNLFTYMAWYTAYEIGSTLPYMFADLTTEGGSNHYLYNGTTYTSFAAWLTAVSGTFVRSSTKYLPNSSGLLASVASGALPFNYGWNGSSWALTGLRLEGAGTNALTHSNAFTTSPWVNYIGAVGGSMAQNATGPDGVSSSAWTITDASGSHAQQWYYALGGNFSGSTAYACSIFVAPGTIGHFVLAAQGAGGGGGDPWAQFNLSSGAVEYSSVGGTTNFSTFVQQYAGGWYRVGIAFTTAASPGSSNLIYSLWNSSSSGGSSQPAYNGSGSGTIYAYGAQLEELALVSSYIPTMSSAAVRAADGLKLPWTSSTATFVLKTVNQIYAAGVSADLLAANTNSNGDILLGMGSATSLVAVSSASTLTQSAAVASWAASNISGVTGSNSGRVLTANDETATSGGSVLFSATPADIWFGGANATAPGFGDISQFRAFTIAATASQLQAQTNTP